MTARKPGRPSRDEAPPVVHAAEPVQDTLRAPCCGTRVKLAKTAAPSVRADKTMRQPARCTHCGCRYTAILSANGVPVTAWRRMPKA